MHPNPDRILDIALLPINASQPRLELEPHDFFQREKGEREDDSASQIVVNRAKNDADLDT